MVTEPEDLYARIERLHKEKRQVIFALGPDWKRYFLALETVHRMVETEIAAGDRKPSPAMEKALEIIRNCFLVA